MTKSGPIVGKKKQSVGEKVEKLVRKLSFQKQILGKI